MKHRLVAVTATIAALLGGSVVAAQSAAAASADCRISDVGPHVVVVGLSPVTKRFGVTTSCPSGWTKDWYLYTSAWWGPFAESTSSSGTIEPQYLSNSDAGRGQDVSAGVWFEDPTNPDDYTIYERTYRDAFTVRRMTAISSFNAGPEPVVKGTAVTVKGLVRAANWDQGRYLPLRYAAVGVQFKRSGTTTWRTVRTVKSSSTGWVTARITQNYSGTWRLSYGGSTQFGSRVTSGDAVDVR